MAGAAPVRSGIRRRVDSAEDSDAGRRVVCESLDPVPVSGAVGGVSEDDGYAASSRADSTSNARREDFTAHDHFDNVLADEHRTLLTRDRVSE